VQVIEIIQQNRGNMKKLIALLTVCLSTLALSSSHREAPFITKNPKVDGTDFYMFKSYEAGRSNFVTLIANYLPLQDAYGGPNYFSLDPEALYEIHIDNTGDAVEDITFQFRFKNTLSDISPAIANADGGSSVNVGIPLINAFPIGKADGTFVDVGMFQNVVESYSVNVVRGPRRASAGSAVTNAVGGSSTFRKPIDNIGAKTFPGASYDKYAKSYIHSVNIPGCAVPAKLFVGQRAESFAVNLGTIFDLVNAPAGVITDPANRGAVPNPIANKNITTLALEVDISCLKSATETVIGGWTTASMRQARVINPTGKYANPTREGGAWAQVSRLGMPLVNEVVIGVGDKDRFNNSEPKDDLANFGKYITNPTLPYLINVLFNVAIPEVPRLDLVTVFATGVPGVNKFTNPQAVASEMLRLNTAIPVKVGAQTDLGAAACFTRATPGAARTIDTAAPGCDTSGYPNGRRPGDDVTDISLTVVEGYLLPLSAAPAGETVFHDAVLQNASQFDVVFPYLKTPNPGS
jgi:Domain of unknown function (DUF4331)